MPLATATACNQRYVSFYTSILLHYIWMLLLLFHLLMNLESVTKNGRLAMLAIGGMIHHNWVTGGPLF